MNGQNNAAACATMKRRLNELEFAMHETALYLDCHPTDRKALDFYKSLASEYRSLVEKYEMSCTTFRRRTAAGEYWTWIDEPWPWQNEV